MTRSGHKKNIDLVCKLFEGPFNEKSIEAYGKLLSEDVILHGPSTGKEEQGIKRLKELDIELAKSYRNIKRTINEIFAVEDKVIVYWTVSGTGCHGENEGKDLVLSGHGIYRIRKDRISEIWQSWDKIGEVNLESITLFLKDLGKQGYSQKASLLSSRERECLKILLQGKTAKETAAILSLTYRTIESYFENIKNKLSCSNKKELFPIAQILEKLGFL